MPIINRGRKARMYPIPAPVGGLNALAPLSAMPPGDASVMENLFPFANHVGTRAGFSTLATASSIEANNEGFSVLMAYNAGTVQTLFGCFWYYSAANTSYKLRIYSIATDGTLTTSRETVTVASSDELRDVGEWTMFTSGAGTSYLIFSMWTNILGTVTHTPQAYDGSSWSSPAITGVPVSHCGIHAHQKRLWFYPGIKTANKPLSAYYLPVGAVAGAVVEFPLGQVATKGGVIVAMRTWTLDGGEGGADDLAVFVTSEGQAIVYRGTDPSASATWGLVGVFDVGRLATPVAGQGTFYQFTRDSAAMKYGADLVFLAEIGITTASRALRPQESDKDFSLSAKIRPLLTDAATVYGQFGTGGAAIPIHWKMAHFPTFRQLIVNIPTSRDGTTQAITSHWYVMNTETGAWTKFSGMSAIDMIQFGAYVYFVANDRKVYKYGLATSDNSSAITWECRQAYNYMDSPQNKHVTLMQPVMRWTGNFSMTAEIDADFNPGTISSYTSYTVAAEANVQPWLTANDFGRAMAVHLKGQTSAGVGSWYATNLVVKDSAGLVG